MRKFLSLFIVSVLVVSMAMSVAAETASASTKSIFDTSKAKDGVLTVRYDSPNDKRVRLMVEKGDQTYTYEIRKNRERIPLQMGNGTYRLTLLENTSGTSYRVLSRDSIKVKLSSSRAVYLQSVQNINWSKNTNAVKKAERLTRGLKTDEEKVKKIYSYVINNISYDYEKASNLPSVYLPSVSKTYSSKEGICYDYSAMFAAMLRSLDIPTRLVMGYTTLFDGYHAWNEVLIDGKWVTIDTTVDAVYKQAGRSVKMKKNKKDFTKVRQY